MDTLNQQDLLRSKINDETKILLSGIANFANIYAIISLASIIITILTTVVTMNKLSKYGAYGRAALGSNTLSFLIGVGVTLLLNLTLLAAARNLKKGLASFDQGFFNIGLKKLGTYFQIMGIIFIIVLSFITLVILFAIVSKGIR